MAETEQNITGPFGGQMTEEGQRAYRAILEKFGEQSRVTLEELKAFTRDELGAKYPSLAIMFGGGQEIMEQGLGFEPWLEAQTDESGTPLLPRWVGFKRKEI